VVWGSVEVAEGTTGGADVGVVDIAIDDVGHTPRMQCLPTKVRSLAQIEQGSSDTGAFLLRRHPLAAAASASSHPTIAKAWLRRCGAGASNSARERVWQKAPRAAREKRGAGQLVGTQAVANVRHEVVFPSAGLAPFSNAQARPISLRAADPAAGFPATTPRLRRDRAGGPARGVYKGKPTRLCHISPGRRHGESARRSAGQDRQ